MTSEAERLRERVRETVGDAFRDEQFLADPEDAVDLLAAIVDELGITEADVRNAMPTSKICESDKCDECRPARALRTLLEASR